MFLIVFGCSTLLNTYKKDKGHVKPGSLSFVRVLEGKLNFLKMVKGENDPTYLKLKERYDRLVANPNPQRRRKQWGNPLLKR